LPDLFACIVFAAAVTRPAEEARLQLDAHLRPTRLAKHEEHQDASDRHPHASAWLFGPMRIGDPLRYYTCSYRSAELPDDVAKPRGFGLSVTRIFGPGNNNQTATIIATEHRNGTVVLLPKGRGNS